MDPDVIKHVAATTKKNHKVISRMLIAGKHAGRTFVPTAY